MQNAQRANREHRIGGVDLWRGAFPSARSRRLGNRRSFSPNKIIARLGTKGSNFTASFSFSSDGEKESENEERERFEK
jgi:hypothetical protein